MKRCCAFEQVEQDELCDGCPSAEKQPEICARFALTSRALAGEPILRNLPPRWELSPPGASGAVRTRIQDVTEDASPVRTFTTGATRDTDTGKLDYEGFLSPSVLRRFAEYMHQHRVQSDGSLRASDNWQKGIPLEEYAKSGWRHHMEWWGLHRAGARGDDIQDALCALLFNIQGYLFELLRDESFAAPEDGQN